MSQRVRIAELSDRYLLVCADDGELIGDRFGFSYEFAAREYAEEQDWEIVE